MSDLDLESVLQKHLEILANQTLELFDHEHVLAAELDALFLVVISIMIFIMQCGFAFLEAGSVRGVRSRSKLEFLFLLCRSKNTVNILIKNMLVSILCISSVPWNFKELFLHFRTPSLEPPPIGRLGGVSRMEREETSSVADQNISITQWITKSIQSGFSRYTYINILAMASNL